MTHIQTPWDDFDPNANPLMPWATYIPARRGSAMFKMHRSRGHALNAFVHYRQAMLYEYDADSRLWVLRSKLDFKTPPAECQRCFTDLTSNRYGKCWNKGKATRIKPGLTYEWLCRNCARMVS